MFERRASAHEANTHIRILPRNCRRHVAPMLCPLFRHMRRNKSCPLYSQLRPQKRIFALRHVRFTPESGIDPGQRKIGPPTEANRRARACPSKGLPLLAKSYDKPRRNHLRVATPSR